MDDKTTRRRILELTGTATVAGLAGCTGFGAPPGGGSDGDDGDGTGATTQGEDHDEEDGQGGGEEHHDEEDGGKDGDHHDEEDGGKDGDHHDEENGHHEEDGDEQDGEGDEHGHDHDEGLPEEPSPTAEVGLATEGQEHHFKPHVVWIEPGGTVTWRLESGSHDAVAYHPDNDRPLRMPEEADPWHIELLTEEGTTAEHTFETEGVYDYYCRYFPTDVRRGAKALA